MELSENNKYSAIDQHIATSFQCLQKKLNNKNTTNEETAAWRQQSLVIKSFSGSLAKECMKEHWLRYDSRPDSSTALGKYFNGGLLEMGKGTQIKFPDNEKIRFPRDGSNDEEMFNDIFIANDQHMDSEAMSAVEQVNNNVEKTSCKSRNTMENFLQGQVAAKTQTPSFCSARQLLVVQTMKVKIFIFIFDA